jgi:hypothetical protein
MIVSRSGIVSASTDLAPIGVLELFGELRVVDKAGELEYCLVVYRNTGSCCCFSRR